MPRSTPTTATVGCDGQGGHSDIEFGYAYSPHADDLPPWHDSRPSVACLAVLHSFEDERFVWALHTTPLIQAVPAHCDLSDFRISQFEAQRPRNHWRDVLADRARQHLFMRARSTREPALRPRLEFATATLWWNTASQRFALLADSTLLDLPDFVPWLLARCNAAADNIDVITVSDDAYALSAPRATSRPPATLAV